MYLPHQKNKDIDVLKKTFRPHTEGMLLSELDIINRDPEDFKVSFRPGTPRGVKKWVKANGVRIGQTKVGSRPIYRLHTIPPFLLKKPDFGDGILPIIKKVAAKTIGLDLVSVKPMSAPLGKLIYL